MSAADVHSALRNGADFCAEFEPLDYVIEPVFRAGSLNTLTALTGHAKTATLVSANFAVLTGRRDILGLHVERGRVAYLTFENPDDLRMRLLVAAHALKIDLGSLGDALLVLDVRTKPEKITEALAHRGEFSLVIVDTLAAAYDGNDMNEAVAAGEFMRRLRPMTRLPGRPAVVVAAHPPKSAGEDNLKPYGSGAILNEVDGNLTLWKEPDGNRVTLHWQGKLRGLDFKPIALQLDLAESPEVVDKRGRRIPMPIITPATSPCLSVSADAAERNGSDLGIELALLQAISANPGASQRDWARAVDRSVSTVNGKVKRLEDEGLVERTLDQIVLKPKGRRLLKELGKEVFAPPEHEPTLFGAVRSEQNPEHEHA